MRISRDSAAARGAPPRVGIVAVVTALLTADAECAIGRGAVAAAAIARERSGACQLYAAAATSAASAAADSGRRASQAGLRRVPACRARCAIAPRTSCAVTR